MAERHLDIGMRVNGEDVRERVASFQGLPHVPPPTAIRYFLFQRHS